MIQHLDSHRQQMAVALIADSNYLSRCAVTLVSGGMTKNAHVLGLDSEVRALLGHFPEVRVDSYQEFISKSSALRNAVMDRSKAEQIFSVGPSYLLSLSSGTARDGWLVYADSDLFFMESFERYLQSLPPCNVVITPHRHYLWNKRRLAKYGHYNVGLVAFRNNEQGLKALQYWADSCLDWCYDRAENGKYADQKYLEHFSSLAEGVFVDNSLGANLAPWNSCLKRITSKSGEIYVNRDRLVYFHYQGLKLKRGRWILGHLNYLCFSGPRLKRLVYRPYLDRIESWSSKPGFEAFGTSRVPTTWIGRLSASLMYFLSIITGQTMKRRNKLVERPNDPPK